MSRLGSQRSCKPFLQAVSRQAREQRGPSVLGQTEAAARSFWSIKDLIQLMSHHPCHHRPVLEQRRAEQTLAELELPILYIQLSAILNHNWREFSVNNMTEGSDRRKVKDHFIVLPFPLHNCPVIVILNQLFKYFQPTQWQ